MKNLLPVVLVLILAHQAFSQQRTDSVSATNWGAPVASVQLSIGLPTNGVEIGSTAVVHTRIRNSSTNKVFIFHNGALSHDFGVSLVDESGRRSDLTPKIQHPTVGFGSLHINIEPGTVWEGEARLLLDPGLPAGKYRLELTRDFDVPDSLKPNRLVSNLLIVDLLQRKK
jgi:hypothetical protein